MSSSDQIGYSEEVCIFVLCVVEKSVTPFRNVDCVPLLDPSEAAMVRWEFSDRLTGAKSILGLVLARTLDPL
jgi:hypothetical protein